MKKIFNYSLFLILLSFIFINNVDAECSYQERKQLLNEAKAVDISFEVYDKEEKIVGINPNTEQEEIYTTTTYFFKMNVSNITSNMFAKITNNYDSSEIIVNYDDLKDGIYSFDVENKTDIITYYIDFYSTNDNCYADNITTKTVKKPKENPIYYYSVCSNEKVENSAYCKHFIDKNFSENEYDIVKELNDIVNKDNDSQNNDKNFITETVTFISSYWYLFLFLVVLILFTIVMVIVRKKRSRL